MSADLVRGARVRILTGMAGGRVGTVLSARPGYRDMVVNVEVEIPVLLMDPDGPTQVVQMPYAPDELEVLEPEPTPALADERDEPSPRAAEARATAAHAIASARSRGLRGRAALADAYQALTAATLIMMRDGDDGAGRRFDRASGLVFDRWARLDEDPASGGAR